MKNLSKKILIILLFFFLSALFAVSYISFALNRKNYDGTEVKTIVITTGMRTSEIAKLLKEADLINSATLFTLYVRFSKAPLQAGSYIVPSNLSLLELVELLKHGVNDVKITFIEGLRSEEIAELASSKLPNVKYEEFLTLVKSKNLEGKLFPDTYFVSKEISSMELVEKLNTTFGSKTQNLFKSNKSDLNEDEVLTLASIVEREEPNVNERPIVAGILISRYKAGELLGVDATVQYIFGKKGNWWPKDLTIDNLNIDNPYNTRKIVGLPPAPICNPSLSSINAVIKYEKTSYNYYLHGKDGKVHYSQTLDEHIKNMSLYL